MFNMLIWFNTEPLYYLKSTSIFCFLSKGVITISLQLDLHILLSM